MRSRISELRILNGLVPSHVAALSAVSTTLGGLRSEASAAFSDDDLRALVDSVRSAVGSTLMDGRAVLAGDPASPTTRTVVVPATSGSVTGSALPASFSLSGDTVVLENGAPVQKASLSVSLDGAPFPVRLNTGSYTPAGAASALRSALGSQTNLVAGVDFEVEVVDSAIRIRSLSSGASSMVQVSGSAAAQLGFAPGSRVDGVDETSREEPGPLGPVSLMVSGRTVVSENLSALADDLVSALDAGDADAVSAARTALVEALDSSSRSVEFAIGRYPDDVAARSRQLEVLEKDFDQVAGVDESAATLEAARAQVRLEQSAWVMRMLGEVESSRTRILFGLS